MSALAGILNRRGGRPGETELARVFAPVHHRGPDHIGTYTSERGFALTVALLVTTPEDVGRTQPVVERNTCIGFDGRIDNRADLLALLGPRETAPQRGDVESDAELALRAFFRWGDGFVEHIIGDFALAVWQDEPQRLLLAKDITGQRALFYYADEHVVVFGSEIAQIIGHPAVPIRPNLAVVAEYLSCDLRSQGDTLYVGVHRVLPAHVMVFEGRGQREFRYWDIDATKRVRYKREVEYVLHFRDVFREAVKARCRAVGPVGAQLSGGIDSSAVVATAAQLLPHDRLRAYSLVFPGRPCDETSYIDAVVDHVGITSVRHDPATRALSDPLDEARLYRDVPDYPNTATHTGLCRMAHGDGVRTLLTGEGSDEFWSGSFAHAADLLASGRVIQSLRTARWDSQIPSFWYPRFGFARYAVGPIAPRWAIAGVRGLRRLRNARRSLLGPSLPQPGNRTHTYRLAQATHAQREAYADLYNAWAAQGNDTGGRFLGRLALDSRSPFMDRRVIELAFAFPESLKKPHDVPKYAVRRALAGELPTVVLGRNTKATFNVVYTRQLDEIGHRLRHPAIAASGWVNNSTLADIYTSWQANPLRRTLQLWMVLAIESWYKSVII